MASANRGFKSLYTGLDLSGWKVSSRAESSWKAQDWTLKFDGKVTEADGKLESSESMKCAGAVVDFRFVEGSKSLAIALPGLIEPVTIQANSDKQFGEALVARGQWNRAEFRLDVPATLLLNGHEHQLKLDPSSPRGKFTIAPDGAIELANIYAR